MNCQECDKFRDDYFDGLLTRRLRKKISHHLASCPHCCEKYSAYERMLTSVRSLELRQCPEEVLTSVYHLLHLGKQDTHRRSVLDRLSDFVFLHLPQLRWVGAAVAILLLAVAIHSALTPSRQIEYQYTTEEIEQATDQVKLALAYLNQVTIRTEEIIEKQVISEEVLKPMKSSIKAALKPLINGG